MNNNYCFLRALLVSWLGKHAQVLIFGYTKLLMAEDDVERHVNQARVNNTSTGGARVEVEYTIAKIHGVSIMKMSFM